MSWTGGHHVCIWTEMKTLQRKGFSKQQSVQSVYAGGGGDDLSNYVSFEHKHICIYFTKQFISVQALAPITQVSVLQEKPG